MGFGQCGQIIPWACPLFRTSLLTHGTAWTWRSGKPDVRQSASRAGNRHQHDRRLRSQYESVRPPTGPAKRLARNFLHDPAFINRILPRRQPPRKGQRVVEIGPGQGAITEGCYPAVAQLDVVELDTTLPHPLLIAALWRQPQFTLAQRVARSEVRFQRLPTLEKKSCRIVRQFCRTTSPHAEFHLIAQSHCVADMHFYAGRRKYAAPWLRVAGMNPTVGWASWVSIHCQARAFCLTLARGAFSPAPKVDSAIRSPDGPTPSFPHPADRCQHARNRWTFEGFSIQRPQDAA